MVHPQYIATHQRERERPARAAGGGAMAGTAVRRVVALIGTSDVSGPGRQLVSLAGELIRSGVEFTILLLVRPSASQSFAEFARQHGVDCRVVLDRGPFDRAALAEVRCHLHRLAPDIVQTHGYKQTAMMFALRKLGLVGAWVAFFEGQTDKNLRDRLYTRLEYAMLPAADRLVVMSELQRQMFPRRPERVRVVYNAVPRMAAPATPATLPPVLQRRRGAGPVPLIGVVGRLSHEKGVDVFLDSLARLKARRVAARGVIIGDGPEQTNLEARATKFGLVSGHDVVFAGRIESIAAVYAALDLLVIPSRSEGLPSVLLEAMQQDLPVVSTRVGAMIEIGAEYPDALAIVPREDADALADGIAAVLRELAAPGGRAARASVVAAFSAERRGRRMLEIYREALAHEPQACCDAAEPRA